MCSGSEAGSYLRLIDFRLRLKDLLGPVTRVKKKKKKTASSCSFLSRSLRTAAIQVHYFAEM